MELWPWPSRKQLTFRPATGRTAPDRQRPGDPALLSECRRDWPAAASGGLRPSRPAGTAAAQRSVRSDGELTREWDDGAGRAGARGAKVALISSGDSGIYGGRPGP